MTPNELVEEHFKLVPYTINKRFKNLMSSVFQGDMDEAISVGNVGLVKASIAYNPDRGLAFATLAVRCIENEILMHTKKQSKAYRHGIYFFSLDAEISTDSNKDKLTHVSIMGDIDYKMEEVISRESMDNILDRVSGVLNKTGKKIIKARMDNLDLSLAEIGKIVDVSQSYVSKCLINARKEFDRIIRE